LTFATFNLESVFVGRIVHPEQIDPALRYRTAAAVRLVGALGTARTAAVTALAVLVQSESSAALYARTR
jgi:hypothetical protein